MNFFFKSSDKGTTSVKSTNPSKIVEVKSQQPFRSPSTNKKANVRTVFVEKQDSKNTGFFSRLTLSPSSKKSPDRKKERLQGMLLHAYIGDAQLEAPPRDILQLRLILSGDMKQGGKDFSIVSGWKDGGSLVSFKHTQVMGQAADKSLSTIYFSLKGTLRDNVAEEITLGEAVLSTYEMDSTISKVVVLNPIAGKSKSNAPIGRLSVTLFLNRYAIDFSAENHKKDLLGNGNLLSAPSTTMTRPSSREYSFLLNRKLNWKGEKASSFNQQTERLLDEDMSKHMKELKKSVQSASNAGKKSVVKTLNKSSPKLAYGTQHAPPPSRSLSPTRKTNMGVGFIGAAWPKTPKGSELQSSEQERINFELEMAEKRRLANLKAVALEAKQRAMEAKLKSEAVKHTVEFQAKEDEILRRALLKQEEELIRVRQSLNQEKKRGLNAAVQAHFLESQMRNKMKESIEKKEKRIYMSTVREAANVNQPKDLAPPYTKFSTLKISKRITKGPMSAFALKQKRRADRARRVREAITKEFHIAPGDVDSSLREIEARKSHRRFMLPIHHVKFKSSMTGDVSAISSSILAAPLPLPPPPTVPVSFEKSHQPKIVVSAEQAAAKAVERYKAALQRRQEQSLAKIAKSSLYGTAFGKVGNAVRKNSSSFARRSQSAPPTDRNASSTALPGVLTKHTVASKSRHEAIGGKYIEFEDIYNSKKVNRADDESVNTELLIREMSREIRNVLPSNINRIKSNTASAKTDSKLKQANNFVTKDVLKKRAASNQELWTKETKKNIKKMTKKSQALKQKASEFSHKYVDLSDANAQLLSPSSGVPSDEAGVKGTSSAVPGFLSSYININAMGPTRLAEPLSTVNKDFHINEVLSDLSRHESMYPSMDEREAAKAKQDIRKEFVLKELVESVAFTKKAAVDDKEVKVLASLGTYRDDGKKSPEASLRSPSSNLRAALFGEGSKDETTR